MKHINIALTEEEHERLTEIKGERSWRNAVLEEFGVE